MKRRYTVEWSLSARNRLAELWLENPAIQREFTQAADQIDNSLAHGPDTVGIATAGLARFAVRPPLSVLFLIFEDDRKVRVIYTKLWDD